MKKILAEHAPIAIPLKPISPEIARPKEIGIYSEVDKLTKATTWGPLGIEAYLAQLYPTQISLFFEFMDVKKARQEGLQFAEKLREYQVETIMVRDELADLLPLPDAPLIKSEVIAKLVAKAEKAQEISQQLRPGFADTIQDLVDLDIERYGEQKALNLVKRLCLDEDLPLGNLIFARDQMNVLLNTRFVSHMTKPIREGEVALYELVYKKILGQDHNFVEFPKDTDTKVYRFEGGDAYIHNGTVYVGVGVRTTKDAAIFMYETLKPQLDEYGLKFAIVEDKNYKDRDPKAQMDFMHLDTFSNPTKKKQIAVCEEEARRRKVSYITSSPTGETIIVPDTKDGVHLDFVDHLIDTGNDVIVIPADEQEHFGCNFLTLSEGLILMPLKSNNTTNKRLEDHGNTLIYAGLEQSTRLYGAAHCMTGSLKKEQGILKIPVLKKFRRLVN